MFVLNIWMEGHWVTEAVLRPATPTQVFSCEFCEISKNAPPVTASGVINKKWLL